jgi:hypothetical protein
MAQGSGRFRGESRSSTDPKVNPITIRRKATFNVGSPDAVILCDHHLTQWRRI